MSLQQRFSTDEVRKRLPGWAQSRLGRTSSLRDRVEREARKGWQSAKGAGRSVTGQAERRWPKRAGIVAAATGAVGGAAAFVRKRFQGDEPDPIATSPHPPTSATPTATTPSTNAANGSGTKVEAGS
jgi:hypothetical protein